MASGVGGRPSAERGTEQEVRHDCQHDRRDERPAQDGAPRAPARPPRRRPPSRPARTRHPRRSARARPAPGPTARPAGRRRSSRRASGSQRFIHDSRQAPPQHGGEVAELGQPQHRQAAGLGDAQVTGGVDDDRVAAYLRREGRGRAQVVLERGPGAADQEQQGGVGRHPGGLPAARATRPRSPGSARQTASSAREPVSPEAAWSPQTNETSKSSSTARTAMDAATDIARSRTRPRPPQPRAGRRPRSWRGCAGCRGTGGPGAGSRRRGHALAEERQWTWRQVVAGDVLAQRVERQVALAVIASVDHALEVAQQAARRASRAAPSAAAPGPRSPASTPRRGRTPPAGHRAGSSPARPRSRRGGGCGR